jgi:hypothetical protein
MLTHKLVRHGVSKRVEDGRRPSALQAGNPRNGGKAVLGVARLQGIKGFGMAGPGETLGIPFNDLVLLIPSSFSLPTTCYSPVSLYIVNFFFTQLHTMNTYHEHKDTTNTYE